MMQSDTLTVTNYARVTGRRLISGGSTWLPAPASYEALTAALLPSYLRESFGMDFGATEQRAVSRSIAHLRSFYHYLPARLRYVGPYHEAHGRLAGKARPDLLTRMSNRFWIGQYQLPK